MHVYFMLQETLGDIVYVQLPDVDTEVEQFGETNGSIIAVPVKYLSIYISYNLSHRGRSVHLVDYSIFMNGE